MFRVSLSLASVLAALVAASGPVWAQLPPASPEQAMAGVRVASVRFDPAQFSMVRGDTATVRLVLFDSTGTEVTGALVLVVNQGAVGPQFALAQAGTVLVRGVRAGSGETRVLVRVPDSVGAFQGVEGLVEIGSLQTEVSERRATRIALDPLLHRPYAETSFRVTGTVYTDDDRPHGTATVRWESTDPSVATVTARGVVTLLRPGSVDLKATSVDGVTAEHALTVIDNPVEELVIAPQTAAARTGDVVRFEVRPLDRRGRVVEDIALSYSVFGLDSAGAQVFDDGTFVAANPGAFRVVVSMGGQAANAVVEVTSRPPPTDVELIGRGPVPHVTTSDLWVFEGRDGRDYVYTGTHAQGGGERMFVWDVTTPEDPTLVDSVVVNARVVNDVKVSADASWAIITREGASDRRNGIVVLGLDDPAHPTVIAELTDSLTAGIHNVWINGDVVYAVNDGTSAMNILDLSDPNRPVHAGRWEIRPGETNKSLHDVWSDGRYAYLSYWDDGLVILDVGAGTHGGTPTAPAYVSSIAYDMGNTHVAWREGDYVFVGDEIGTPDGMRGYIHVMDVSDIDRPKEVAKYEVPEAGTHNIWVEDGTLYIAYYQGGLRVVDVTGELRGDLYRQGREIGLYRTAAEEGEGVVPNSPMAWGPQPHKGYLYVSDMNSGLWVVKHQRPHVLTP